MAKWLVKSEPSSWSFDQQVAAGAKGTHWNGVRNHTAKQYLMAMKKGEEAFFYHSNEGKAVVGIVKVIKTYYPDPTDASGKFGMVDFAVVRPLPVLPDAISSQARGKRTMFNDPATAPEEAPESKKSSLKQFIIVLTIVLVGIAAVRFFLIYRERQEANKPAAAAAEPNYTDDQMVYPRHLHQTDMKDARELDGKRVWVAAGGQLNAYPATPTHMDYAHPGPLLLGAERIDVVNFIEGKAPASAFSRVPKGDGQVFMLFHRKDDPEKLWGTPVGYKDGKLYTFYLDSASSTTTRTTLYKHWGARHMEGDRRASRDEGYERDADQYRTRTGQQGMVKGHRATARSSSITTVKPVTVTFVKDKATDIS